MARKEVVAYQLRLDGGPPKPRSRFVWEPGELARLRSETEVARCDAWDCGRVIVGRRIRHLEIYQPFEDLPDVERYCEPCSDRGAEDNDYSSWCFTCERQVYDANGYRSNFKDLGDELICVRCFQSEMFRRGHTDEQVEGRTIPCDWYDHSELRVEGWEEGETFSGDDLEATDGRAWREYCRRIKAEGGLVLTDQGRTSIIGSAPDCVTVWVKWPERGEEAA
jgi:hypothetical protein